MKVLGIESTCDETACSIVEDGKLILSNVVTSQIDLHAEYGGVVPELCCRRHIDIIIPVIEQALIQAKVSLKEIDLIAVARGPGLIGPLLIGLNTAKALSLSLGIPFVGVNHIEAHLYAALMSHQKPIEYPCLGVVLSGGHTTLLHMKEKGHFSLVSQTVDDAIGEAFDKTAKIMNLPYPGGPLIESLALQGDPSRFHFKSGQVKGRPLDFSFSGLKTAVYYAVKDKILTKSDLCDISASFQQAALSDIVKKCRLASQESQYKYLIFGGGVTNNQKLREMFKEQTPHLECLWPSKDLTMDNAAMIAGLGYEIFQRKDRKGDSLTLEALTRYLP